MELDFIPLDYSYFEFNKKDYVRIIGRTYSGKKICLIDNYSSYFYVILKPKLDEEKVKHLIKKIKKLSGVVEIRPEDKNFMGEKIKALKITVENHSEINKVSEKIKSPEIDKIREHDISSITRYILEKNLTPLTWHKITGEAIDNSNEFGGISSKLHVDLTVKIKTSEIKNEQKEFIPKILAFDIETDEFEIGKGKILMISLVSNNFKKVLTWKKQDRRIPNVEYYKSEEEMIKSFVAYYKKISPDILTGYYSDGFDLPYLKSRAEKNKIMLNLGIDDSNLKFTGGMNPRGKISGVVHVDLLKFIQTAYSQYLQSETLSLNEVASELLGEKKHDYEFKHENEMEKNDWEEFFKYNLQDSVLTYNLFMKIWPDMSEFSRVMQEPLFEVSRAGMASNVENYIIHNLAEYNEIIERKPEHNEIGKRREQERYEGAFVLEPRPALYNDIVMFDFTSMYGSVIVTYNLSKSTFLEKKSSNALEVDIGREKVYFEKEREFFPKMLEEIIKLRKKYKQEYKKYPSPILKARSNAFKLLANAAYGYQGFFGARYYCREAAASTAALARKVIKDTIEKITDEGYEVIYSDTDSVCLLQDKKSKSQVMSMLKNINSKLPGIMELELEDFYKRGIWVTTRGGEIGAKKKYALINEKGKMKIRGFETVRRDWCPLARELQNKVLEKILKEGNEKSALEFAKEIIKKLKERKVDKKLLIIRTQLKKPLSEYKAVTPHVTIARKMLAEGLPVEQNMLIEYFIAESNDKKALAREKASFPSEKKPYDITYYLTKQVIPAVENIFQVFNVDMKELIEGKKQMTLGEF
ncbi:MAG: DNA-directed DNA polymerase [Candidatus Pacearchaeota archaeon]